MSQENENQFVVKRWSGSTEPEEMSEDDDLDGTKRMAKELARKIAQSTPSMGRSGNGPGPFGGITPRMVEELEEARILLVQEMKEDEEAGRVVGTPLPPIPSPSPTTGNGGSYPKRKDPTRGGPGWFAGVSEK